MAELLAELAAPHRQSDGAPTANLTVPHRQNDGAEQEQFEEEGLEEELSRERSSTDHLENEEAQIAALKDTFDAEVIPDDEWAAKYEGRVLTLDLTRRAA